MCLYSDEKILSCPRFQPVGKVALRLQAHSHGWCIDYKVSCNEPENSAVADMVHSSTLVGLYRQALKKLATYDHRIRLRLAAPAALK